LRCLGGLYALCAVVLTATLGARANGQRPFAIGERAEYNIKYGPIHVGNGSLSLMAIDTVRGRDAYRFRLTSGVRVNVLLKKFTSRDTMQSWVDTATFQSLRFNQDQMANGRPRIKRYEIFPERQSYADGNQPEQPSVTDPLDDIAFLYFVRTQPLEVGTTLEWPRYFKATNNPVALKVLRKDTIEVAGRKWSTVVIRPIIKTSTMFSNDHDARVWISDDSSRVIVQLNTKLSIGSITMRLTSYQPSANDRP
jgi:hypothetical protein